MASVSISERTEALLQRLRAEIERETGRAVSEREVLERMVEREFESRAALVDSFREDPIDDDFEGLSDEEIERFFAGTSASGDPIEEDDIDRVLYEEEAAPDSEP
mgnify:CR=1 FL=1|jgi:hypothetical protein